MIYLITFIVLLIPSVRFDLMRMEGKKDLWYWIVGVWLVLLAGLRYRVGGDTLTYMQAFDVMPGLDNLGVVDYEASDWNPLWFLFCAVFKTLGDSFTLLQICHAAIVNGLIIRFFKRYCPLCSFTAILFYFIGYFCYFNMEVMRESLCIAILLTVYPLIEQKKWIPYYIIVVISVFIHTSALVMALLPFACLFKRDNFWLTLLILAGVIVSFKVVDIVSLILYSTLDGTTAEKVKGYTLDGESNIAGILVLLLSFLPYMAVMYIRGINHYTRHAQFGVLIYFLILFQTMSIFLAFFSRFSNYFVIFGIAYMLNTFFDYYWDFHYRSFSRMVINGSMFVLLFSMTYFYIKSKDKELRGAHVYDRYIPYYSVFNQEMDKTRERLLLNEHTGE